MIRVGDRLKKERVRQGLSIEEVAKATRIKPRFIQALEDGDYKTLPSSAYIQGFVRNYAEYLGLPIRDTVAIFKREFDEREFLGVLPESFTKPRHPFLSGFRLGPMAILITVCILFILLFVGYQYKAAFFSPSLSIIKPAENAVMSSQVLSLQGQTDPNTAVTVNDAPVYIDKNGNFKKDITVFTGANTITIKAVNNFGKESTVIRHVTVK